TPARSPRPFFARQDDTIAALNRRKPIPPAPEMPSSQSIAPARPRSRYYNFVDAIGSFDFLRYAQLCASRTGVGALFFLTRLHGFWRNKYYAVMGIAPRLGPFRLVKPFPAVIAEKVFYDAVFQ